MLGGFHHRVACRLTGRKLQKGQYGDWVYPLLEDAIAEASLKEVETYVYCRQNTLSQYTATRPMVDLCLAANSRLGPRVEMG